VIVNQFEPKYIEADLLVKTTGANSDKNQQLQM